MNFCSVSYLFSRSNVLKSIVACGLLLAAIPATAQVSSPARRSEGTRLDLALIDDVEEKFTSLFDGETLNGWEQKNGTATYQVVESTIQGETAVGSPNSFLCTTEEYGDFELRFEVKVDDGLNSGVQIRSLSKPGFQQGRVHGPQVEIESGSNDGGRSNSGFIYSEGTGRNWISPNPQRHDHFKPGDWNRFRVIAEGNRIQTWVNGNYIEDVETAAVESLKGFIGLQVHSIGEGQGPYKVQWRNLRIRELKADDPKVAQAMRGTPEVDGKIDEVWSSAARLRTGRFVAELTDLKAEQLPATGYVRCLWDDEFLYCLVEVTDPQLATGNSEAYEKDSVEFFVDGNNAKADAYDDDDAQYRVDATGENTVGPSSNLENFKSSVSKTETGYLVEARIKLKGTAGQKIGFDVQVNNDAGEGRRQSVAKWSDASNETWQSLSKIGTLELIDK